MEEKDNDNITLSNKPTLNKLLLKKRFFNISEFNNLKEFVDFIIIL